MVTDSRKIAAILAADVVGYSRLTGVDEQGALAALKVRRAIFDRLVQELDGQKFGCVGDSLMAQFPSAINAVRCALNLQHMISQENDSLPADRRMALRVGVNLGHVIEEKGVLFGDGVNIATRLQTLANSGGVLVSGAVYEQVRNKLSASFTFIGKRQVKNIAEPVARYEATGSGVASRAHRVAVRWNRRLWLSLAAAVARKPEAAAMMKLLDAENGDTLAYQYAEVHAQWGQNARNEPKFKRIVELLNFPKLVRLADSRIMS